MAAASAGALQSGSAVSGIIPSSVASNVDQQIATVLHHQQHQQQQQHQHHHHQSQLLHQSHQQIRPQQQHHHTVQFHSVHNLHQQQQQQQRHPFIPRVGNGAQLNSGGGTGSGGTTIIRNVGGAITEQPILSGAGIVTTKQSNQMLQCQPQPTPAANLAPGWRRLISNNEIVYVSPSGATLRTHGQIKDYLLSPNTCKCGLPCPLRPEYFFDFNYQIPNMLLQLPTENGLPTRSLICLHQRRFYESQQNILHKEIKRRKYSELPGPSKISTSPVSQCNSVAIHSGNVMQTSQQMSNSPRVQMMAPQIINAGQQQISNMAYHVQQKQQQLTSEHPTIKTENEKQIGSVTLSKTPPWRKNSILQQQSNQLSHQSSSPGGQIYSTGNERVPPLPQAHLCQQTSQSQAQNLAAPWHEHSQNRFVKTRTLCATKKKPNFKDDPTGYLDHQTAMLHNSILNVHSPDPNDSDQTELYLKAPKEEVIDDDAGHKQFPQEIKTEHPLSVIQQNQNVYPQNIEIKQEPIKMEPLVQPHMGIKHLMSSNTGRLYQNQQQIYHTQQSQQLQQQQGEHSQIKQETIEIMSHQSDQPHLNPSSNFMYNQNPRMIAPSQIMDNSGKSHQHLQPPSQPVLANVPSSQPYIVDKHNQLIRGQPFLTDDQLSRTISMSQATTTTIGGQTVTHFPNGMVQVEQNCDNMISLKPQQQIQLQQQIQQHNMLYRQNQQIQKIGRAINDFTNEHKHQTPEHLIITASQESPVSSSTTFSRSTPERRNATDNKGPPQVGAISTSNESPLACSSPSDSSESTSSSIKSSSPAVTINNQLKNQQSIYATSQTTGRNTITSVTAGKAITATTSVNDKSAINALDPNDFQHHTQKLSPGHMIPVSTSISALHLQPVVREPGNQLIMTSTGQLIVMPTQSNKSSNQVIINSPNGNNLVVNNQQSVVINQQGAVVNNSQLIGNSVDVLNNQSNTTNIIQSPSNGLVIQNSGIVQAGQNMLQSPSNLISSNNQNFIVNSSNNMQPMILNNSNIIQQNGQNLITANAAANLIQNSTGSSLITTANGSKVISSNGSILNNQNINQVIGNSGNLISPNNGGILGQQTVVLNTLPNGYVIQPNFATVDGQVVGQIVNQDGGTTSFLQQQSRQIILTSPDSKRKAKKRKSSVSSSPSTPSSLSPQQSPNMQQQQNASNQTQGTMMQIASQYPTQGFQISPGIQGIAVMNKNSQTAGPQQQIIFQNGQIIQPVNLIGQQLLVPAGLVVAPETTLLQIQNVGPCGSIITPQGMVLRAPSPQNKNFLSPSGSGQQFIVSGNSQMSPIGQLYGTPVGLVVPQTNSGGATYVQQNTTIVQQQTTMMSNNDSGNEQGQSQGSASPPDTTTHSPRSPERPPSERSGGSDMVQCVSSSEPDSVVSPVAADSAQSPSTTDYDRSSSISYQTSSVFKPSDAKMRRVQTPPQFSGNAQQDAGNQMRPDSHESPTNSPPSSATSTTSSLSTNGTSVSGGNGGGGGIGGGQLPSFSIGQLVWGAARGHPAWPGKVVNPPDGSCTPSDSTWVQWFGGRSNPELVAINSLKSLSEGLEAHHKAQKDTRKSRKLNSQLERAIQEAMAELDRISMMPQPTSTTKTKSRGRQLSSQSHQRTKPIKIAPAPPCANAIQQQIRQPVTQMGGHQQQSQTQHQNPPTTQTK